MQCVCDQVFTRTQPFLVRTWDAHGSAEDSTALQCASDLGKLCKQMLELCEKLYDAPSKPMIPAADVKRELYELRQFLAEYDCDDESLEFCVGRAMIRLGLE